MATKAELEAALDTVGRLLRTEADNRGWCAAYDAFVEEVNAETGMEVLRKCDDDPDVMSYWVQGTITFRFSDRLKIETVNNRWPTRAQVKERVEEFMTTVVCDEVHAIDQVERITIAEVDQQQAGGGQ